MSSVCYISPCPSPISSAPFHHHTPHSTVNKLLPTSYIYFTLYIYSTVPYYHPTTPLHFTTPPPSTNQNAVLPHHRLPLRPRRLRRPHTLPSTRTLLQTALLPVAPQPRQHVQASRRARHQPQRHLRHDGHRLYVSLLHTLKKKNIVNTS